MTTKKVVFVEPSSTHLHVYSRFTIPRLGSVLLGTIMRDRGWDAKGYIEDIAPVGMGAGLAADSVGSVRIPSRAVPLPCPFWSVPGMDGSNFRTHSIGRVLEELKTHSGTPYVFFADDIFTANRKRTKDLLARMIAEGVSPPP